MKRLLTLLALVLFAPVPAAAEPSIITASPFDWLLEARDRALATFLREGMTEAEVESLLGPNQAPHEGVHLAGVCWLQGYYYDRRGAPRLVGRFTAGDDGVWRVRLGGKPVLPASPPRWCR